MECPYCKKEMKKGILSGDARQGIAWKEGVNAGQNGWCAPLDCGKEQSFDFQD